MNTATGHKYMRALGVACVLLVGTLALSGCRDAEQSRLINYKAGVYKGKPDTPLSDKARADAHGRAYLQSGAVSGARPGGGDVRL